MQIITIKTPTVVLYSQVNIAWHQLFLEVSEEEVQCDGDYFFSLTLGQFYFNCSNKARLLRMQRGGGKKDCIHLLLRRGKRTKVLINR